MECGKIRESEVEIDALESSIMLHAKKIMKLEEERCRFNEMEEIEPRSMLASSFPTLNFGFD